MTTSRLESITSFIVMDVLERAHEMERQGVDVIHLEVGEPDFDTPECIKAAAHRALDTGHTHYTHSLGMLELREAICRHYADTYGVSVHPDQVVVCSGTSPAILLLFSALLEIGRRSHHVRSPLRLLPQLHPVSEGDTGDRSGVRGRRFPVPARSHRRKNHRPDQGDLHQLAVQPDGQPAVRRPHGGHRRMSPYVISDEIYHGLVYEGREHSILEFTDRAFVFNGFSKLYAMTGLRLGYLIAPRSFMRSIQKLQQNFFISANAMVQTAGIAALKEAAPDMVRMKSIYNERRQYMIGRLKAMGLGITVEPTGAFYVFANAKHVSGDSYRLAFDILEKAHVGVTPGIDFGSNGEGYLRFSYASSMENIGEGMDRLERYLRGRSARRTHANPEDAIRMAAMKISSADFVTSAVAPSGYPPTALPEIAFAGRSNVGKSSLINRLVNRKGLVKTSRTPGRTQLINFFDVNGAFTFVDLPGYGFARVPEAVRLKWGPMIETYLDGRETLAGVVAILDIRRTPGVEEQNLTGWLESRRIPMVRVLTKTDKLSRNRQRTQIEVNAKALRVDPERLIVFSAKTGKGRDAVWQAILELTAAAAPSG